MQSEFYAVPYGPALQVFEGAKGIVIEEHDAGEEAVVAQFYDNYLNGVNRVHRHAEMFVRLPKMLAMLNRIVTEWTAFDRNDAVSGAELVDWFGNFRLDVKACLAEAERAITDSCTDAGIQSLQLVGETDDTSVLPMPNVHAMSHQPTEGTKFKCDNCGHVCSQGELKPVADIDQRLDGSPEDPDTVMPAGECPKCGALSYQVVESAMPAFVVNVRCVLATPSDPEDEFVEGRYKVTFDPDAADFSNEKLASIALDVFHAKQGINELDEFEIVVLNQHGQPVDQDEYHHQGTGEGFASIEKIDDIPAVVVGSSGQLSADGHREEYSPSPDGEHPKYSRSNWREEVRQENTIRGYWDWVASMIEQEEDPAGDTSVATLNNS